MQTLKKHIKNFLAKITLHLLKRHSSPLDELLYSAGTTYCNKLPLEPLRDKLENYFSTIDEKSLKDSIEYSNIRQRAIESGYKIDLLAIKESVASSSPVSKLLSKKLTLLRQYHIRLDILVLKKGAYIPPHAHNGVVSGFYVLEGTIGIRHYHVTEYGNSNLKVRKTIDQEMSKGQFTTNSDNKDNIHWLKGVAEISILYRFNTTNLKTDIPSYTDLQGRLYVNPTAAKFEAETTIDFITPEEAKCLTF